MPNCAIGRAAARPILATAGSGKPVALLPSVVAVCFAPCQALRAAVPSDPNPACGVVKGLAAPGAPVPAACALATMLFCAPTRCGGPATFSINTDVWAANSRLGSMLGMSLPLYSSQCKRIAAFMYGRAHRG
jgi:hypothetical protein